jgi:hypothetical protein
MTLSSKQLLNDLEALNEEEIESYFDQNWQKRLEAYVADQLEGARASFKVAQTAADEARNAKLWASAALIIAAGAMLAAVASAFFAFLALRGLTISW